MKRVYVVRVYGHPEGGPSISEKMEDILQLPEAISS